MFKKSVLKISQQWWKAQLAFYGTIIGGVVLFLGLFNIDKGAPFFWLSMLGILISISAFLFGCVAIRCPNCGAHWVWRAVSGKDFNKWTTYLLDSEACFVCGATDFTKNSN